MQSRPTRSTTKKLVASGAVLAAVGAFVSFGVFSAFTSSVNNSSSLGSANVALSNTPSTTLISLTDIIPGDLITRCVAVQNTGNIAVDVALTKTTGGDSSLLGGLLASIEEGTLANGQTADANCTGFTASGVYRMGTSAISTAGNYSGGAAPSALTTENYTGWTANTVKYYRIKVALPLDAANALKNLTSTLQLTWTASSPTGSTNR